jgi:hypothetical protein
VLRCFLLSFLVVSFALAADQATQSPAIVPPVDSNPPGQADSNGSHSRIHFGGLMIGVGYSHASGGYPYGYAPEYWAYSPYSYWPPFYHPGYFTGFSQQPNMGNVKIAAPDKTSLVYLDGALAGRLDKLKDMWLEPGVYHLEVRNASRRFTQKIYVLSGKTLKVTPDMMVTEALQ